MYCIRRITGRDRRGDPEVRSVPAKTTDPSVGRCMPMMVLASVDLPDPDSPTTPTAVPRGTRREMSFSTRFVRTPLPVYLKTADWKRDPNARVDVESLKKLSAFMRDKLQWLEKPVNVDSMVDQSYLPR